MCLSTPFLEECGWDPGELLVRRLRRSPSLFCDVLVSMNLMGFSLHILRKTLEVMVRPHLPPLAVLEAECHPQTW